MCDTNVMQYDPGHCQSYGGGWVRHVDDSKQQLKVIASRSVSDSHTDSTRTFADTFLNCPTLTENKLVSVSSCESIKSVIYDISKSGLKSVAVSGPDKDGNIFVDVLSASGSTILRSEVSAVHGKPSADAMFGGCSWSFDEKYFCYAAQPGKKTTTAGAATVLGSAGPTAATATKFDYSADWGEKYVGVADQVLCVFNTETGRCTTVGDIDASSGVPGQPVFVSCVGGAYSIVYTQWRTDPRLLGLFTCYHRRCRLVSVDVAPLLQLLDGEENASDGATAAKCTGLKHRCITDGLSIARSARCSSDVDAVQSTGRSLRLVFIGRTEPLLVHNSCWELFAVDVRVSSGSGEEHVFEFGTPRVVVDIIQDPPFVARGQPSCGASEAKTSASSVCTDREPMNATIPEGASFAHLEGADLGFPGLYLAQLPRSCFLDRCTVALTSAWGSREEVLLVNVCNCSASNKDNVFRLTDMDALAGERDGRFVSRAVVEATESGTLLCSSSSPTQASSVSLFTMKTDAPGAAEGACCCMKRRKLQFTGAWASAPTFAPSYRSGPARDLGAACASTAERWQTQALDVQWSVQLFGSVTQTAAPGGSSIIPVEAVLLHAPVETSMTGKMPIVFVPHGGPHSVFGTSASVMAPYAFLATTLRALVIVVNYRGSIGFGQRSIECLPGYIGDRDMQDILDIVADLRRQQVGSVGGLPPLDFSRMAIVGGSHGGYLAGQAIGQHPLMFRAAVMRNPVTNIPAMYTVSDIPDWCIVESLGLRRARSSASNVADDAEEPCTYDFDSSSPPTATELSGMFDRSPIKHVRSIVTPTMFLLGAKDRRVPMCQGIEFHHALRCQGVATKCMVFPEDTHALDNPASQRAHWSAVREWFAKYLE